MLKIAALCTLLAASTLAHGQLRVGIWNITFYDGEAELDDAFRTALFDTFEGRSFRPDVLLIQEINATATQRFLDVLNSDPRGGQDWALATVFDGPGVLDTAVYFRSSKIESAAGTLVSPGGGAPRHPRNLTRYTLDLTGYEDAATRLVIYNTHMQAFSTPENELRRLDEAIKIRADAQMLPEGTHFLVGGDLNVKRSTEPAYIELTESRRNDNGRVFDPIASPGEWLNNPGFVFIHSQDPITQMDDRLDQILLCDDLLDGEGLDYLGDWTAPFSTSTFDDPNHSYRTWGNDGSTFDLQIRRRGNRMVGEAIATALFEHTQGLGGHIPVYLDLLLPPRVGAPQRVSFGRVPQGAPVEVEVEVSNTGDVRLWQRDDTIDAPPGGIQPLRYTLEGDARLTVPVEMFVDEAGDGGVVHRIGVDTTEAGAFEAIVRVLSNAPDEPIRSVRIVGEIIACEADLDGDGSLTLFDFLAFQNLFDAGDPVADFDGDGSLTLFDFLAFQSAFDAGC